MKIDTKKFDTYIGKLTFVGILACFGHYPCRRTGSGITKDLLTLRVGFTPSLVM